MNHIKIQFMNSTTLIQPASLHDNDITNSELFSERLELTPSDLQLLNAHHIQKGLLFHNKPPPNTNFIGHLQATLSRTLDIIYPLAGRLVITTKHDQTTFHVDCNGAGVLFVHAVTDGVTVADILDPVIVPDDIVYSLFLCNGVLNYEAAISNLPLVAVQVTELVDGFFVACSVNHALSDGTFFWKFFNVWSEISRNGYKNNFVLSIDRPDYIDYPIRVPFCHDHDDDRQAMSSSLADLQQTVIHFSKERIAELKKKANAEMGFTNNKISSLQALMAHLWISVTRGRNLKADEDVRYMIAVGLRSRLEPPLPEEYLGTAVQGVTVQCKARELLDGGLGWVAAQINREISSMTATNARKIWEDLVESPSFLEFEKLPRNTVISGSSPRFDVYGNDFGWGRPVAVRSGTGNKLDGKLTPFAGAEEGSIDFEVCLSPTTIKYLIESMG